METATTEAPAATCGGNPITAITTERLEVIQGVVDSAITKPAGLTYEDLKPLALEEARALPFAQLQKDVRIIRGECQGHLSKLSAIIIRHRARLVAWCEALKKKGKGEWKKWRENNIPLSESHLRARR